jgi:hypothetical protein
MTEAIDIKEINDKWNQLMALKANTIHREAENNDYKSKLAANNEAIANNKRDIDALTRELRPILGLRPGPKSKVKAPRKPRATKPKEPPQLFSDNESQKSREQLEAEARSTATCPHCEKLLADCTCQVSEEAAEKHQKLSKKK